LQIEKTDHRLAEIDPTMPSDLSGHAILEKVLRKPPAGDHDQRALFLLASIVTAHGYLDGNGRVARIAYAAEQIGGQKLQGKPPVFVAPYEVPAALSLDRGQWSARSPPHAIHRSRAALCGERRDAAKIAPAHKTTDPRTNLRRRR
jgi:hypothetical protein